MNNYQVVLNFNDGSNSYDLPLINYISDPQPGMKATVIHGNRSSGALVIPGGLRSEEIIVRGILFDADGYEDLSTLINEMKTKISTDVATLTLKYYTGSIWQNTWQYTVRRIEEIEFGESLRTGAQPYTVRFLIISY